MDKDVTSNCHFLRNSLIIIAYYYNFVICEYGDNFMYFK